MNIPAPLPAQGFLLETLGYLEEPLAAIAINVALQTLVGYRKAGHGPEYTVVGRTILYSRESLRKWLEAGGTRAFDQDVAGAGAAAVTEPKRTKAPLKHLPRAAR